MHEIEFYRYPAYTTKDEIAASIRRGMQRSSYYSHHKIRWLDDKIYFGEEEAMAALKKVNTDNYDKVAVKYWEPSEETQLVWIQAYRALLKAYSVVLELRKRHSADVKELLKQAECQLRNAQTAFKEVNKSATLMWLIRVECYT